MLCRCAVNRSSQTWKHTVARSIRRELLVLLPTERLLWPNPLKWLCRKVPGSDSPTRDGQRVFLISQWVMTWVHSMFIRFGWVNKLICWRCRRYYQVLTIEIMSLKDIFQQLELNSSAITSSEGKPCDKGATLNWKASRIAQRYAHMLVRC